MEFLDFLLNVIGLAFWVAGCGFARDPSNRGALTLASNLKPAEYRAEPRWPSFVALAVLLLFRPVVYSHLGRMLEWTAMFAPGAVTVMFRSDHFWRMTVYSFVSFGWALFVFYGWLILISVTNGSISDQEPITRRIRQQLGWVGRWPAIFQLLLPAVILCVGWWLAARLFARMGLIPFPRDIQRHWQQCGVVALGAWLPWKWAIVTILLLKFMNTYVYFGNHPFWDFIQATGRRWLMPIRWLRIGKLDAASVVGIVIVWMALSALEPGGRFALSRWYAALSR